MKISKLNLRKEVVVITCLAVIVIFSCGKDNVEPPPNDNYVVLVDYGFMVMKKDMGKSTWTGACTMCEQLRLGGFSDWRLPTQGELAILYNERLEIGGFEMSNNTRYWSSTPYGAGGFYVCQNLY